MPEVKGDLWHLADEVKPDTVAITTNGFVQRNGQAVMGKGCALEAGTRWPERPMLLGERLRTNILPVEVFDRAYLKQKRSITPGDRLVAFRVKPRAGVASEVNVVRHQRLHWPPDSIVPGWAAMADMNLIAKSSGELMGLINKNHWQTV